MRQASKLIVAFGASILLVTVTGCATAPGQEIPESGADVNLDRIICHENATTGTRMVTKTCKTQREWEADAAESKEINRKLQRDTAPRSTAPTATGG
jgi:hypothetical protein